MTQRKQKSMKSRGKKWNNVNHWRLSKERILFLLHWFKNQKLVQKLLLHEFKTTVGEELGIKFISSDSYQPLTSTHSHTQVISWFTEGHMSQKYFLPFTWICSFFPCVEPFPWIWLMLLHSLFYFIFTFPPLENISFYFGKWLFLLLSKSTYQKSTIKNS